MTNIALVALGYVSLSLAGALVAGRLFAAGLRRRKSNVSCGESRCDVMAVTSRQVQSTGDCTSPETSNAESRALSSKPTNGQ
jgi:hypothetical protein